MNTNGRSEGEKCRTTDSFKSSDRGRKNDAPKQHVRTSSACQVLNRRPEKIESQK